MGENQMGKVLLEGYLYIINRVYIANGIVEVCYSIR